MLPNHWRFRSLSSGRMSSLKHLARCAWLELAVVNNYEMAVKWPLPSADAVLRSLA